MVHTVMGLRGHPATGLGVAKTLAETLVPEMIEMIAFIGVDLLVSLQALLNPTTLAYSQRRHALDLI